ESKSVPARLVVMLAGVTMNLVLAFAIYAGVAATVGSPQLATTQLDSVTASALPPGAEGLATLRHGDRIVRLNGDTIRTWNDLLHAVWNSPGKPIRFDVRRDTAVVGVTVTPDPRTETDTASPRPHVYGAIGAGQDPPTIHVRESPGQALVTGYEE